MGSGIEEDEDRPAVAEATSGDALSRPAEAVESAAMTSDFLAARADAVYDPRPMEMGAPANLATTELRTDPAIPAAAETQRDGDSSVVVYASPHTPRVHPRRMSWWLWITLSLMLVAFSAWVIRFGIQYREYAFKQTIGVHFLGDISNGFSWGRQATRDGLFHVYDLNEGGGTNLDYTTFRLTVVTLWYQWAQRQKDIGPIESWQDSPGVSYELTRPMLNLNTGAELISAILVFLIIRLWRVRRYKSMRPIGTPGPSFVGVLPGLFGALLLWFNPAVLWDSHCWPQWDVWVLPFFLAAVLLASVDWWFAAGMCIMVGAFFKGQMLLGAPVLMIWPLWELRFGAVLRVISGAAVGAAASAVLWFEPTNSAITWYMLCVGGLVMLVPFVLGWRLWWPILVATALAGAMLVWPWSSPASLEWKLAPLAILGAVAMTRLLPVRLVPAAYALAVALIVFCIIPLYDGRTGWYEIGFVHGADKYDSMLAGNATFNLPKMLAVYNGWPHYPDDPVQLPLIGMTTFRTMVGIIYGICLTICSIGAAIQSRRRDTRFLVAMVAPWVIFYILLTQMHGRYLVWGAGMSALLAGESIGLALLGVVVSIISFFGIIGNQHFLYPGGYTPQVESWIRMIYPVQPHLGWALILTALIFMYYAIAPRRRAALA